MHFISYLPYTIIKGQLLWLNLIELQYISNSASIILQYNRRNLFIYKDKLTQNTYVVTSIGTNITNILKCTSNVQFQYLFGIFIGYLPYLFLVFPKKYKILVNNYENYY